MGQFFMIPADSDGQLFFTGKFLYFSILPWNCIYGWMLQVRRM